MAIDEDDEVLFSCQGRASSPCSSLASITEITQDFTKQPSNTKSRTRVGGPLTEASRADVASRTPDRGRLLTRRQALCRAGMGFGSLALGTLMAEAGLDDGRPRRGRGADLPSPKAFTSSLGPKALAVRPQGQAGDPPVHERRAVAGRHLRPQAVAGDKYNGKPIPLDLRTERKTGAAMASPFKFKKYGQSGIEVSDLFAHVGECIDDICVIRSMHADVPNHEPSLMLMNCGDARQARPSLGSWLLYGLGSENQNLPGFVVLCPGGMPISEAQNWQSAFLPGIYQGTYVNSQHTEIEKLIEHIKNKRIKPDAQRAQLDLLMQLNREHMERRQSEAQLEARIQSFELAFRMQSEAGDAFDVSKEPQEVKDLYGPGVQARQLLVARRFLERGRPLRPGLPRGRPALGQPRRHRGPSTQPLAGQCDRPIAALLKDLKRSGMLDDTLVIWGGEFGRTPTVELPTPGSNQGKMNGRDHNHYGFTMWLAGGGVKRGHVHGATDEFGFQAVEDKVHVHDLHATILHLLGFDHETFTYRYAGRDFSPSVSIPSATVITPSRWAISSSFPTICAL